MAVKVWREGEALRSAGSEFQTVGAMEPKDMSPKVFRFVFGMLRTEECDGWQGQREEDRHGGAGAERRRQTWRSRDREKKTDMAEQGQREEDRHGGRLPSK